MVEFSQVESYIHSFAFFTKFTKVYSREIFQEKSSTKFYSGKIVERTQAGNFSSS